MIKINQKGFSLIEAMLIIVVLALLAGAGYYVFSKQTGKTATTRTSTAASSSSTAEKELSSLKSRLMSLGHITDSNLKNRTVVYVATDPNVKLISPAQFNIDFNASLYATQGDAATQSKALNRTKVADIFTEAGLKQTDKTGDEPLVNITYENDAVLCSVADSQGVAHVGCASQSSVLQATLAAKAALTAIQQKYSGANTETNTSMTYTTSDDSSVQGIYIDNLAGLDGGQYGAYAVNTGSSWQYVASNTEGAQSIVPPACSVIDKPAYKNVFNFKPNICS